MTASMQDHLNLPQLRSALTGTRFAAHMHHFASVGSTNTRLVGVRPQAVLPTGPSISPRNRPQAAAAATTPGTPPQAKGLYLSALVKPPLPLRDALLLSLSTGLAAWQAVNEVAGPGRGSPLAQ